MYKLCKKDQLGLGPTKKKPGWVQFVEERGSSEFLSQFNIFATK